MADRLDSVPPLTMVSPFCWSSSSLNFVLMPGGSTTCSNLGRILQCESMKACRSLGANLSSHTRRNQLWLRSRLEPVIDRALGFSGKFRKPLKAHRRAGSTSANLERKRDGVCAPATGMRGARLVRFLSASVCHVAFACKLWFRRLLPGAGRGRRKRTSGRSFSASSFATTGLWCCG